MTISCPPAKIERLQNVCKEAMKTGVFSVHTAEIMIGLMESIRPVSPMAALCYRPIQKQLLLAKYGVRRPIQLIFLSTNSKLSLAWWISNAKAVLF